MRKIDVAGLKIDAITKSELLSEISERIERKQKTFVSTPYSEFLYASIKDEQLRTEFNKADFAIPDGVGVIWAHAFLAEPVTWPGFLSKLQIWWQMVWTGASILLNPKYIYRDIPEKIVGADFIWDLAKLAEQKNFTIFLWGSKDNEAKITAQKLIAKFPNLKIVGTSNKNLDDNTIFQDLDSAKPDMLLVALAAQETEKWLAQNLQKTPAMFAIGLGGTFDYIAGTKKQPPQFVRKIGLEWLYRLFTQPSRVFRIYRGFVGLIFLVIKTKTKLARDKQN